MNTEISKPRNILQNIFFSSSSCHQLISLIGTLLVPNNYFQPLRFDLPSLSTVSLAAGFFRQPYKAKPLLGFSLFKSTTIYKKRKGSTKSDSETEEQHVVCQAHRARWASLSGPEVLTRVCVCGECGSEPQGLAYEDELHARLAEAVPLWPRRCWQYFRER